MASRSEIDDVLTRWSEALRRRDSATLAELVTTDGEFWSPGQAPLKGRDEVRASFDALFRTYSLEQKFEEVERIESREWVLLRGIEHNIIRPRSGIGETVVHHRLFTVLRKDNDGQWRFARGITQFLAPEETR